MSLERIDHYMTEAELKSEFGEKGWKQLPHTVVKRHHFTQARITVDEHHIGVYADKEDGHMKRAPHPKGLLPSSPVTPSLATAVMNGKYVNAVPLYRLEKDREEDKLKELKPEDRLKQRQVVIKPLVDALFVYLKSNERKAEMDKLKQAVTYALNQEKYLRVFLEDGEVPMDNNASERAIRGF